ncbi:hypothetical protein FRB91_000261 [Serendipita sp. 411]|nr:hypothetical protein FRB91_000261 [Serendipita sp. 411]KAG8865589.1 hypothetical protein FRC20_009672 [Serendipita sp. 405]
MASSNTAKPQSSSVTAGSSAAGKQKAKGDFEIVGYLEEATSMLDKIKSSAANVTICQGQIDQIFDRSNSLLEAFLADSMELRGDEVKEAAREIEETFKQLHRHILRFAIYGRPKAFVNREEISTYFEQYNIHIDQLVKRFAVIKHPDLKGWEGEYYQAKLEDEAASFDQLWEIIENESDMKVITELGEDAVASLKGACAAAINHLGTPDERKDYYKIALNNLDADPTVIHPVTRSPTYKPRTVANLRLLAKPSNRASSSSSSLHLSHGSGANQGEGDETPAAKAKREEAEMERKMAELDSYDEPPLPMWEPRRPPPGKGPGSIDNIQTVTGGAAPPPPPADALEDLPPSYS